MNEAWTLLVREIGPLAPRSRSPIPLEQTHPRSQLAVIARILCM